MDIAKTVEALTKRGFIAKQFETAAEALNDVVPQIESGQSVGVGGSVTVRDMGLTQALRDKGVRVNWHWEPEEDGADASRDRASCSDVYLTSSNALTETGILVNIDGMGNRVCAMTYGVPKVFVLVGRNKICPDVESAIYRVKNVASPLNAQRLNYNTPCAKTGKCNDCNSPDRICKITVIHEGAPTRTEMHVYIINEDLGY